MLKVVYLVFLVFHGCLGSSMSAVGEEFNYAPFSSHFGQDVQTGMLNWSGSNPRIHLVGEEEATARRSTAEKSGVFVMTVRPGNLRYTARASAKESPGDRDAAAPATAQEPRGDRVAAASATSQESHEHRVVAAPATAQEPRGDIAASAPAAMDFHFVGLLFSTVAAAISFMFISFGIKHRSNKRIYGTEIV